MDDPQQAPDEDQDQPTTPEDAPEGTAPEGEASPLDEDFDLSQVPEDADREWIATRHRDLRADYTRKTQALAEQRKQVEAELEKAQQAQQAQAILAAARDPEHPQHRQALDYLGLEVDDEDDDFEPDSGLERRLAALEAQRQQDSQRFAESQKQAQREALILERFDDARNKVGRDFDESELRFLLAYAESNPDEQGHPDVDAAVEQLKLLYGGEQKRWTSSKKAPRTPGGGTPAERDVDITDQDARLAEATRIAEAAMGA